jgi:hypothetical protein
MSVLPPQKQLSKFKSHPFSKLDRRFERESFVRFGRTMERGLLANGKFYEAHNRFERFAGFFRSPQQRSGFDQRISRIGCHLSPDEKHLRRAS